MKKKALAIALFALFTLGSCETLDPARDLPGTISIQKTGHNIKSFAFLNIPSEGIPRGHVNDYDIKLVVTYDDDTTYEQPLNMKTLPRKVRDALNTVGIHKVDILFRGEVYSATFKILPSDTVYTVNYYDYRGNVVAHYEVEPGGVITIPDPIDRDPDYKFIYQWEQWEVDLTGHEDVDDNYEIYPVYSGIMKRYHVTPTDPISPETGEEYHFIHEPMYETSRVDEDDGKTYYYNYFHLGRSYRTPILIGKLDTYGDYYFHDYGYPDVNLRAWFEVDKDHIGNYLKDIMLHAYQYVNNYDNEHTHFTNETYLPDPSEHKYEYIGSLSTPISEVFGGNVITRLKDVSEESEIYTEYIGPYFNNFGSRYVEMNLPSTSSRGYYRLVAETDVDIFVCFKTRKYDDDPNKLFFAGAEVYMTVDWDQISFVVDYRRDSSDFAPTNKQTITYRDIAYDAYTGVYA